MSARVSLFRPVKIGDFNYLFFIVGWTDYQTELKQEVRKQFDAFGADLGVTGKVVEAYDQRTQETFKEIKAKDWPTEFRHRLEREFNPLLLIIKTDFVAFDPNKDQWAVIWFSEYKDYAKDLPQLFHKLALMSHENEDIFKYLDKIARKNKLKRFARFGRLVGLTKYFEIGKPQVFGVSIDVKAILQDIAALAGGASR